MSYYSETLSEAVAKQQLIRTFTAFALKDDITSLGYKPVLEDDNYAEDGYNCYKINCFLNFNFTVFFSFFFFYFFIFFFVICK